MNYTLRKWTRNIVGLKQIHKQIIKEAQFKEGDKVIDVGCGTGMLLECLHKKYGNKLEYMGIEPDEATRAFAEKQHGGKEIKFKRAFANQLPSVQDYYTHVICMVSFHHFPKNEWEASIEEFKRVLVPGGKLIIVDFGKPTTILGYILNLINNPCRKLAKGLEDYLKIEGKASGLIYQKEHKQFGYIIHLIFTK